MFLFNEPYHGAWVNSKALKICQIDRNTPDPSFGRIEKDDMGEPTGLLYETAMALVGKTALDFPMKEHRILFESFQKKL